MEELCKMCGGAHTTGVCAAESRVVKGEDLKAGQEEGLDSKSTDELYRTLGFQKDLEVSATFPQGPQHPVEYKLPASYNHEDTVSRVIELNKMKESNPDDPETKEVEESLRQDMIEVIKEAGL